MQCLLTVSQILVDETKVNFSVSFFFVLFSNQNVDFYWSVKISGNFVHLVSFRASGGASAGRCK